MRPPPAKVLVTPESVLVMDIVEVPGVSDSETETVQTLTVPVPFSDQVLVVPNTRARVFELLELNKPVVTFLFPSFKVPKSNVKVRVGPSVKSS